MTRRGYAYLWSLDATGKLTVRGDLANVSGAPKPQDGDQYGTSIANIGSINGDAVPDIAVGAVGVGEDQGAVFILRMNSDGSVKDNVKLANESSLMPPLDDGAKFGTSVAMIDQRTIAVGTGENDGEGSIYILKLTSDGQLAETPIRIGSGTPGLGTLKKGEAFGAAVVAPGDLNGDSIDDLIVGSPGYGERGALRVLYMGSDFSVKSSEVLSTVTDGMPTILNGDRFGTSRKQSPR